VQAAGGETVRFNYRLWSEDDSLVRLANCVIPRSEAALRWTAAWFRSAEAGNNIRWVNSSGEEVDDGSLGTMDEFDDGGGSCVSNPHPDNPCHIDGVIVPPDDGGGDNGDPDWGDDDDWGGDDPCWDCTGGGGGTDPGSGEDCDPDAIYGGCEEECSHYWYSDCVSITPVEAAELDKVVNEYWINNDERCVKALNDWSHFRHAGHRLFTYFSSQLGGIGTFIPTNPPEIGYSRGWHGMEDGVGGWNRRVVAQTSLHEAVHYGAHRRGEPMEDSEDEAQWVEKNCVSGHL